MTFAVVPGARPDRASLTPIGSQQGFTYIGLLIAVVLFGLGAVGASRWLAAVDQAGKETELLFVGHQFRAAIRCYLQDHPQEYPPTLDDLLIDRRSPVLRRCLRRIYIDPITGKREWGLVPAPTGGFMGVYSLSDREPRKRGNFSSEDAGLVTASPASSAPQTPRYSDWKFVIPPP